MRFARQPVPERHGPQGVSKRWWPRRESASLQHRSPPRSGLVPHCHPSRDQAPPIFVVEDFSVCICPPLRFRKPPLRRFEVTKRQMGQSPIQRVPNTTPPSHRAVFRFQQMLQGLRVCARFVGANPPRQGRRASRRRGNDPKSPKHGQESNHHGNPFGQILEGLREKRSDRDVFLDEPRAHPALALGGLTEGRVSIVWPHGNRLINAHPRA